MLDLHAELSAAIRDIPDFPKKGIVFKDITPILSNPDLSRKVLEAFAQHWKNENLDGVVGIESRGFIFGMMLAQQLNIPFIPIRKKGKLPYHTVSHKYDLEYGSAELEIHTDAIKPGQRILVHDDLLATGGTAQAAAALIKRLGGKVSGYSFLVELSFLSGSQELTDAQIHSLITY